MNIIAHLRARIVFGLNISQKALFLLGLQKVMMGAWYTYKLRFVVQVGLTSRTLMQIDV